MFEIKGKYTVADVKADYIDKESYSQILELTNEESFKDCKVSIMPDVHAGKGCVVGFTSEYKDKIIPNLIGVDIGCGITTSFIDIKTELDFKTIDEEIRKRVPCGFNINYNNKVSEEFKIKFNNIFKKIDIGSEYVFNSIGTLGGGNHFIEINYNSENRITLNIHSGSRKLGHSIATYHQNKAIKYCEDNKIKVPKHLCFLEGEDLKEYVSDMELCVKYAKENRREITKRVVKILTGKENLKDLYIYDTIHNYIKDGVIRKGAISSEEGENVTIPLNMKDGVIYGIGKGNAGWNNSAPHGAGRLYSRSKAKKELSLDVFKEEMDGVYSSCIDSKRLDESPMAYKTKEEVMKYLGDTIIITGVCKPLYNFKG
jgi:RNA-splicing ligase RtcB